MSVNLGSGTHALVESPTPLAIETSEGKRVALNLSLHEVENGYEPEVGLAPVRLPLHASEGATLSDTGVSLTPVSEQGAPIGTGAGVLDHAGVFYGDTESAAAGIQDLSMLAKPTTFGFEMFSTLFSERSPEHLYFKVGLPEGATLEQGKSGEVLVTKEKQTVSSVDAYTARDAEGTAVPVSETISSPSTIELTIARKQGQYRYPIVVDPLVEDTTLLSYLDPAWVPASSNPSLYEAGEWGSEIRLASVGSYEGGEFVAWEYETQGKSKVYEFEAESAELDLDTDTETLLEAWAPGPPATRQNWGLLSDDNDHEWEIKAICAVETTSCEPTQGAEKNMVRFIKYTLAASAGFEDVMLKARVWISQEEAPTASFNTTSEKIAVKEPNGTVVERENVLRPGSKGWIGPYTSTAFEVIDHDPGIGVSFAAADGGGWSREMFLLSKENDCRGVQCPEEYKGKFTYFTTTPGFTKSMPSGEYSIESFAEDPVGLYGYSYATVRVDATPPHAIKISGLPSNNQIGEGVYKLHAEATDGEPGTPSSGIQSLKLGIDGAEAGEPKGSCSTGPCTASAEWTINGGQLSAGPHTLTIVATDNAGNVEHQDFEFYVHHASPLALGPGSLNPQSGNYSLAASDVSMGPGLTLTRTYSSRNLTAGVEGPLGSQWAMNLGGSESLVELPDGSMTLVTANGGQTAFARNSKGELEAPKGDTNFTLTPQETAQKVPTAYVLKDASSGVSTTFSRPTNYLQSTPSYYGQVGWQGPGSGQLNGPMGVATDAAGDVWVADTKNNRIEEFNPQGEYVTKFGSEGTGAGQFNQPHGIAIDTKGNVWVSDTTNNRIEEFTATGSFIRQAGTEGAGKLNTPQGIATDASNNVWVADTGNNRLVEFNEKGEYVREAAKTVGSHALAEPIGVATDSSNDVWATDAKNHRVVEFSSTGTALKELGSQGTSNGKFETPTGIALDAENDIWVADSTLDRVQEFNSKGEYLTQVGSAGANGGQVNKPYLITVSAQGALTVADTENSRAVRWAHAAWLPSTSEGAAPQSQVTYTFKTVLLSSGTEVEATRVVAPHESELSCSPTIKQGCRALILKYDEGKTTATGQSESEWGEYEGHLNEVIFAAYNPATKSVQEIPVAQYTYDSKGRLRAEWDPRISPALKTRYSYDEEGHVTALTPPGQQPWLMTYGTSEADSSAGRLLSVIRPSATTAEGNGKAPQDTTVPSFTPTKPVVGEKVTAVPGTWSNSPLTYSYQWTSCVEELIKEVYVTKCSAIPGATNATYTPLARDRGHRLMVTVTATNAAGSTACSAGVSCRLLPTTEAVSGSSELSVEPSQAPPSVGTNAVNTVEYNVPTSGTGLPNLSASEIKSWAQEDAPLEGTAIYPPDEPMGWPAQDYKRATIYYFDAEGHTVNTATPSGGIATAEYGANNDVVRSLSADNRAAALKEGSKSAEVSKLLDTRNVYNEEGNELLETLGPQHKIKLAKGGDVEARHRVKYAYNQAAPKGTTDHLVTETTSSAVVSGKEEEQKITQTRYSGQNGLGWTLRKPTSVTVDPYGLKLTTTTLYNAKTGAVIETGSPEGTHETEISNRPSYSSSFGSYGSGNGQLREPEGGLATDASGDVWVSDTENSRLEEFNSKQEFVRTVGSSGEGAGQFKTTYGVTVDSKGNVWATDEGNDRVEEFTGEGVFIKMFGWGVANGENKFEVCTSSCRAGLQGSGNGEFYVPEGIAVDSKGNIFVADRGNKRVQEFNSEDAWVRNISLPEEKEGPFYLTLDSSGDLWVAYSWDNKIGEFSNEGKLIQTWGTAGSEPGELLDPYGVAVGPEGNIWVSEYGNNRVQVFTPTGEYVYGFGSQGSGPGQFNESPHGLAFFGANVYVLDSGIWWENTGNSRVEDWHMEPLVAYSSSFGSYGSGNGQLREPEGGLATDASGDVWVSDTENSRLEEFNSKQEFVRTVGSSGEGAGQFKTTYGVTVDSKGNVWATDEGNDRVEEFTGEGVFIKMFGWGVANGENKFEVCTSSCRAGLQGSGNGEFYVPEGIAVDSKGNIFVADRGNKRVQEFNSEDAWVRNISLPEEKEGPFYLTLDSSGDLWVAYSWDNKIGEFSNEGKLIQTWGTAGSEPGELLDPYGVAVGPEGNIWVSEYGNNRVQVFTPTGGFMFAFGSKGNGPGQFNESPHGLAFYGQKAYVLDSGIWWENTGNSRIENWTVTPEVYNTNNAHDQENIYYSAVANSKFPQCGNHVEWEGLQCETLPASQPETPGVPALPVVTVAGYNVWGEPEKTEETFGSVTRTRLTNYDSAGRITSTEETSSADTALPKVTDEYSETTGQLVTQTTKVGEETQTVTKVFDKVGRLSSYTDADKNTTTYEYETSGDGRLLSINDGKGTQAFAYDPTTGALNKLVDSSAGTFTATFDVEGHIDTETYPNGMTATYIRNSVGQATGIEYVKTTHCAKTCPEIWFSETEVPSIEGQALTRTNTLTSDTYSYDNAGRMTEATEEPVGGKGCVTRLYGYDEESNRTSLTTREPVEGKCATTGGTVESHTYDSGNRLTDTGVTYDAFGDTTKLPAADAGGHELTTEFYVDGQVRKQTQNGQTNTYSIDPAGRIRKIVAEGTTNRTTINHYSSDGEGISWKEEGSGKFTRLIPGIDGNLAAVEINGETPTLQLDDLEGNVVATAALAETETKLISTYSSTEFGVPVNGTPPTKYSWGGAAGLASEVSSGTLVMGTVSYVPQLGRPLQTEAVTPPGQAVNGAEGVEYTDQASGWSIEAGNSMAQTKKQEYEIELQKAEEREAEEKLKEGAEDPGELTFVFTPDIWTLEAERLEVIAGRTQLIGLALSVLPVIGEVSGESSAAYAEYLRGWADVFKGNAKLMEVELERDKKDKIPIVVYALYEEYGNIPLLGRFPIYFTTDQCEYLGHINGNTTVFCPGGKYKGFWEVEGEEK
jgi:tripartite motif-containing protein 71